MNKRDWSKMSWTEKAGAVHEVFGSDDGDSHGDALLYLWDRIQERGLADAYITELTRILDIQPPYTPTHILAIMRAYEPDGHWPAALKAAGKWEWDD